jgi:hypothetical protein
MIHTTPIPPRADEHCQIIQFSTAARDSAKRARRVPTEPMRPERSLPEPLTETCKNQRLRNARREVWWDASALTSYWRARLKWHTALGFAQDHGIADADQFPPADNESRHSLVDTWRAALAKQLLTPAPDIGAVSWKRAQFNAGEHLYSGVKPERIERAIADDIAFLEAHPTRRSIAASRRPSKPEQEQ